MGMNGGPTERDVQAACLAWLALWGAVPVRVNSSATVVGEGAARRYLRSNNAPGCSDALCCAPDGRFLAVEFKRPGGRPTVKQEAFLARVRRSNGLALVVTSVADLHAQLTAAGYDLAGL